MITCTYCSRAATMRILSNPENVCAEHAMEFWTGLLGYTHDRADADEPHELLCACHWCERLRVPAARDSDAVDTADASSASRLRGIAIAAAGPSPQNRGLVPIRLAS